MLANGATLAAVYAKEPELVAAFSKRYPQARVARAEQEILDDKAIQLVVSAAIPNERAPLGMRVMQAGKDFMVDKPGVTTLRAAGGGPSRAGADKADLFDPLRRPAREPGHAARRRTRARRGDWAGRAHDGHRAAQDWRQPPRLVLETRAVRRRPRRPRDAPGDYFLAFTKATRGAVVAARTGNLHHPDKPDFEDFGDAMLQAETAAGYFRVDWFTPGGVATFGDSRLTVMGTDGYLEVRPNVDLAGRPGGSHLFLVDQKETRYIEAKDTPLPYGPRLLDDIVNRTETAMTQAHTFLVAQLVLEAQAQARPPVLSK